MLPLPQVLPKSEPEVDWYANHGAEFLKDTDYPALPGFSKSFVTYQPLGHSDAGVWNGIGKTKL